MCYTKEQREKELKSHCFREKIEGCKDDLPYDGFLETDHVLCAILLRLADVLDFDMSRAPHVLYEFQKISTTGNPSAETEWKKYQVSNGFKLMQENRTLVYRAVCEDMQDEYTIMNFLDYVDEELENCSLKLKQYGHAKWKSINIPMKAERYIERRGYQTGEYRLTLEADNVLDLLMGDDLYSADVTFIRELLQNALDAVRARRAVDYRWNWEEENYIIVSDWSDKEENQWFRIDDSGIGMDEQAIMNYFLRVGRSYYQSDEFKKLKYDNKRNYDFMPISKFGIGILSCFLKGGRMEVSTRRCQSGEGIRFSMKGTKGYYSLAVEEKLIPDRAGINGCRENVRWFPMKAAGYIELVGRKIFSSGLGCQYPSYYGNMEYGKFTDLLNDAEFCIQAEEMLECRSGVSIKDMKEKMALSSGKEEIAVTGFWNIFYDYDEPRLYFLKIFERVLLQTEFEISWDFNRNGAIEYFITGIRKTPVLAAEKELLPMTFVHSFNNNTKLLTNADNLDRCALNAEHPFLVWLMKNAEFLAIRYKSLWKRIRKNICLLDSEHMKTEIDNFLKEIQKRGEIYIPDNVWVKDEDFLELF
ncbi:hypothetical protein E5329_03215 [Petralouisia muris]|uniref:Uncharacterized protein n=1 Tax=Petralouisia muris TaxID=3032872 RepID=A0AC61S0Q3_9FIRM|nr:ATP-binding protein [Petralouisia muris]TGY97870.1 hypothetical protein E5329_03215 [Petralouisia muris]